LTMSEYSAPRLHDLKAIASWSLHARSLAVSRSKMRAKISIFASGGGPVRVADVAFYSRADRSAVAVINSLPFESM